MRVLQSEDAMRKSRFTEEQIIATLKQVDAGAKLQDVVRKLGVTEQTYYRWKAKFGGMEVSDARKLRALEDENRRLKQMVADQALDIQALKAVVSKKW
jgi:putative transposase